MNTLIHSVGTARRVVQLVLLSICGTLVGQSTVTAKVNYPVQPKHKNEPRASLFWLVPLTPALAQRLLWTQQTSYRLLQRNKMFMPHFLVVPVGATVSFPNADPFFHNVFSLFDGKRFDLGLYEAGKSRDVRFERPGISYIFCNIHPEMGAVVIALNTALWSAGEPDGQFRVADVPEGSYEAHLWVEGEDERTLAQWTHRIVVHPQSALNAGTFQAKPKQTMLHLDEFGKPYKRSPADY